MLPQWDGWKLRTHAADMNECAVKGHATVGNISPAVSSASRARRTRTWFTRSTLTRSPPALPPPAVLLPPPAALPLLLLPVLLDPSTSKSSTVKEALLWEKRRKKDGGRPKAVHSSAWFTAGGPRGGHRGGWAQRRRAQRGWAQRGEHSGNSQGQ